MKAIECINFVSQDAPNILLIADIGNQVPKGRSLKHFKNSHNIYTLTHDTTNNFEFYIDLPSKHSQIFKELDKHNLYKFSIHTQSFGSILAFFLAYTLTSRIEKILVCDFYLNSYNAYNLQTANHLKLNYKNWIIPNSINIPILFLVCIKGDYVLKNDILDLIKIFKSNIRFVIIKSDHKTVFEQTRRIKRFFILFNGISYKNFWNKVYPSFFLNKNLPIRFKFFPHRFALKICCFLYK